MHAHVRAHVYLSDRHVGEVTVDYCARPAPRLYAPTAADSTAFSRLAIKIACLDEMGDSTFSDLPVRSICYVAVCQNEETCLLNRPSM